MLSIGLGFLSSTILSSAQTYDKVTVDVFYEAQCPSCQAFITTTLANTLALADISAITDLKMVPYGNTKKNADGSFTCQHGQGECESDVLEMCTMYKLSGDINSIIDGSTSEQAWPFIQCMELAEGDPTKGESCFSSTLASSGLTWQTVVECSEQEELDVQNAGMKATPKHDYVPWVVVDDVLLSNTNSLLSSICKAYTGPPPVSCQHYTIPTTTTPPPCLQHSSRDSPPLSLSSGTCSCTQYGGGYCSGFCSGSYCPCMNCQYVNQTC